MENDLRRAAIALREFALGLPGAYEEFPWDERVVKVNKKVFVFLGRDTDLVSGLRFSVKLPQSGQDLLTMPFAEPTGYGLGKHGWVVLEFSPDDRLPEEMLFGWIEESYRAVAPKKLVAQLDSRMQNEE
jgi:predicted DNA-binding protein (MmcQ/YjbR family)